MAKQRIAAAVILTRGSGDGLELFLAQRNPELRFFGGYWAFLGGVVDAADHDGDPEHESALMRCAWRELFEEAGVLPAELAAAISGDERQALRARLMSRAASAPASEEFRALLDRFPELCSAGSGAEPKSVGRLTTPPFAPLIYRTLFMRIELPAGEEPEVIAGELLTGEFVRAGEVMQRWVRGELLIAPPVVHMLSELASHGEAEAWARLAASCAACAAGKLHEIRNVPGLWMAPLATDTIPPATTTNAYLIGSKRAYLVDPASFDPAEQARLFAWIDVRLASGIELAGVIASHHHHDHIGAIVPVAERYGVPVLGHRRTLERLKLGALETRELKDGDELDLGPRPDGATAPWKLRVYHTPGHDQGHIVLVENAYQAAIVGDLCSTVSTIVIDPPEGHMATYLKSLERMLAVPMGVLHPAHGPVARDGHALLRYYLKHRHAREARIVECLGRQPSALGALADQVYDDVPAGIMALARRSLLAGLQKLAEEGRATELEAGWILGID
jgi:ribonuclease/clavin/mitogillin